MTKRKDRADEFGDTNLHGTENVAADEGTTAEEEKSDEPTYVKVEDVKLGDVLVVTGDEYDCVHDGEEKEVKQDWNGRLYVDCEEGKHHLDKGTDIHDYVIGFLLKQAAPPVAEKAV